MEWELQTTQKDALGLTPPATVADDAYLANVRQTGMSTWMLIGLQNALEMASTMGRKDDADRFEAERRRYRRAFEEELAVQTKKSGGWIPPALEGTLAGNHWDELMTLYPEPLFEPFEPRVTSTTRESREATARVFLSMATLGLWRKKRTTTCSIPLLSCTTGNRLTMHKMRWCGVGRMIRNGRSKIYTLCFCTLLQLTRHSNSALSHGVRAPTTRQTFSLMGLLRRQKRSSCCGI